MMRTTRQSPPTLKPLEVTAATKLTYDDSSAMPGSVAPGLLLGHLDYNGVVGLHHRAGRWLHAHDRPVLTIITIVYLGLAEASFTSVRPNFSSFLRAMRRSGWLRSGRVIGPFATVLGAAELTVTVEAGGCAVWLPLQLVIDTKSSDP